AVAGSAPATRWQKGRSWGMVSTCTGPAKPSAASKGRGTVATSASRNSHGRLSTRPKEPSVVWSQRRTTVRRKLGSGMGGSATRRVPGASGVIGSVAGKGGAYVRRPLGVPRLGGGGKGGGGKRGGGKA